MANRSAPPGGFTSTLVAVKDESLPFTDVLTWYGIMRPCTGLKSAIVTIVTAGPAVSNILTGRCVARSNQMPIGTLDFGGVAVTNPRIAISSDNFTKGLGNDLILGVGILRQLHLYIAYEEEKLYITPALAH